MGFLNAKIKKSLLSSFDEIDNSINHVNRGGCGFFAKHLYNSLIKKGLKPELILLVHEYSVKNCEKCIVTNNVIDLFKTNWSHVMVKIKTPKKVFYIDNGGFFDDLSNHPTFGKFHYIDMPFNMLDTMLKSRYQYKWNDSFNRSDNKQIKKILKKHLEL
jgi:hypothetical protein